MELRVWPRHIRAAKICMNGSRDWFVQQGWSWASFVRNGVPASDVEATGCPIASRAVAEARREAEHGSR